MPNSAMMKYETALIPEQRTRQYPREFGIESDTCPMNKTKPKDKGRPGFEGKSFGKGKGKGKDKGKAGGKK